MDFVIDTVGSNGNSESTSVKDISGTPSAIDEFLKFKEDLFKQGSSFSSKKTSPSKEFIANSDGNQGKGLSKITSARYEKESIAEQVKKALLKSVITPDFEKLPSIPSYEIGKKRLQKERKKEREKSKGKQWFGMPQTEMTEEIKRDLEILQMRSVLDPKHFYKKNDLKVLPKYFQVGKVLDSPAEFYNNRLTKKERKKTLVDELLADAEFQKYNKRKYKEIIDEKQKTHYKAWRQAKRLKKKKK